jgi:hypothetical protein
MIHRTCYAVDLASIFEHYDCRYAANSKTSCNILCLLRIDLGEANTTGHVRGCLAECRSHHFAWTTPVRPEIDDYREVVSIDETLEVPAVKVYGSALEDGTVTFTARGIIAKPVCRDPIDTAACRTNQVQ